MAEPARKYEDQEEPEQELGEAPQPANDNRRQGVQDAPRQKKGIGALVAIALVSVALCFDGIQFLANFLHVLGPPIGALSGGIAGMIVGAVVGVVSFVVTTVITWNPVIGGGAGVALGGAAGAATTVVVGVLGIVTASALAVFIPFWVGILSQIVFAVWFFLLGRSCNRNFATRLLIHMSMFVSELVPLINTLPGITLGVVALILLSRAEAMFGADVKGIPLSKLGTLLRGQLPQVRQEIGRASSSVGERIDSNKPRTLSPEEAREQAKRRGVDQVDLSGNKFFDVESRFRRRYGASEQEFIDAARRNINRSKG